MPIHRERQALINAILDTPEDDAPRLVFADWLAEHGQPEWGDFIRLQCALRQQMLVDDGSFALFHTCPREQSLFIPLSFVRPNIRRALLRPFRGYRRAFEDKSTAGVPLPEAQAHAGRGFVELLLLWSGLACQAFAQHSREILSETPLRWLGVKCFRSTDNKRLTPDSFRCLLQAPCIERIRELDLFFTDMDDDLAETLWSAGDNLQRVRLATKNLSRETVDRLKSRFGRRLTLRHD